MNRIVLQLWEESEKGWGVRPDGCSIHIDNISRDNYVNSIYKDRSDVVPDSYDRVIGDPIEAFIGDLLYKTLEMESSIRLMEHEFNNLVNLEDIIIKEC